MLEALRLIAAIAKRLGIVALGSRELSVDPTPSHAPIQSKKDIGPATEENPAHGAKNP
jgi:hypothetical protein